MRGARGAKSASQQYKVSDRRIEGSLRVSNVGVEFAGIVALAEVDLHVDQGEVLGLIGPNGAGKSTLVNVFTGFQRPSSGSVWLDDRDITRLPAHRRPKLGIVRTFQSTRAFKGLTIAENVLVCAARVESSTRRARQWSEEVLETTGLAARGEESAATLSTGDAQRLGVARSLAVRPRFLLLDEPAAGLNDRESEELVDLLRGVADTGEIGMILIEHNLEIVRALCQRIHVLDEGRTIGIGTPAEVQVMPAVLSAYLGSQRAADVAS
jgi:branched-chain amino acid transport system ATP-binding protein